MRDGEVQYIRGASALEPLVRTFETGATRSVDTGKPDFEGYLSPAVLARFGEYMTLHRLQADGSVRASDNWQKGIPRSAYLKSLLRHVFALWGRARGVDQAETEEESLCAILFNVQGSLHELLKMKGHEA
jgi:hypothetical protein